MCPRSSALIGDRHRRISRWTSGERIVTRPPRPAFAGATYHVVARGNNSSDVFTDDSDRYAYLALLAKAI
ncbi:MAG: hypothetical protein E6H01_00125, partial [Bacillati bacterium ANGP1]